MHLHVHACALRRGAGTDANVTIELYGDKGFVGATRLDNNANNFERGRKDDFEVVGSDVGVMDRIVIGHDNSGERTGGRWAGARSHSGRLCVRRHCSRRVSGTGRVARALWPALSAAASLPAPAAPYQGQGSGKRSRGRRRSPAGPRALDVEWACPRVRATRPTGLGAAWHLAQVEVFHPGLNKTFTFPCDEWLEYTKEKGLDNCKRVLKTGAARAAGAPRPSSCAAAVVPQADWQTSCCGRASCCEARQPKSSLDVMWLRAEGRLETCRVGEKAQTRLCTVVAHAQRAGW